MESGKIVLMNVSAGKERRHKQREGVVDTARERESGTNGEGRTDIYTTLSCVK